MIIVEGEISSVNEVGKSLVLKATVLQDDTVALDPGTVIKAGAEKSSLKELKPDCSVNIQCTMKNGKRVATCVDAKNDKNKK